MQHGLCSPLSTLAKPPATILATIGTPAHHGRGVGDLGRGSWGGCPSRWRCNARGELAGPVGAAERSPDTPESPEEPW